jgi:type IV pilus assembly protein PilB
VKYKPDLEAARKLNLPVERIKFFCRPPSVAELAQDAKGNYVLCSACRGVGFRGRIAVYEWMVMSERLGELLTNNVSPHALREEAVRNGLTSLDDESLKLVVDGTTSIQEILR